MEGAFLFKRVLVVVQHYTAVLFHIMPPNYQPDCMD